MPDLIPFFRGMLTYNHRRPENDNGVFSFKTPEVWLKSPGIRSRYEGLIFHRNPRDSDEAKRIVGVGHQVFDQAISQAIEWEVSLTLTKDIPNPLVIFRLQDALTGQAGQIRQVVIGVMTDSKGQLNLIRDETVLGILNEFKFGQIDSQPKVASFTLEAIERWLAAAHKYAQDNIAVLGLPFRIPQLNYLALFWPESYVSNLFII